MLYYPPTFGYTIILIRKSHWSPMRLSRSFTLDTVRNLEGDMRPIYCKPLSFRFFRCDCFFNLTALYCSLSDINVCGQLFACVGRTASQIPVMKRIYSIDRPKIVVNHENMLTTIYILLILSVTVVFCSFLTKAII